MVDGRIKQLNALPASSTRELRSLIKGTLETPGARRCVGEDSRESWIIPGFFKLNPLRIITYTLPKDISNLDLGIVEIVIGIKPIAGNCK